MRNALNRLRRITGEVLARDGVNVRLPESTRVDLWEFEREARNALTSQPGPAATRRALDRCEAEVLASRREAWAKRRGSGPVSCGWAYSINSPRRWRRQASWTRRST